MSVNTHLANIKSSLKHQRVSIINSKKPRYNIAMIKPLLMFSELSGRTIAEIIELKTFLPNS